MHSRSFLNVVHLHVGRRVALLVAGLVLLAGLGTPTDAQRLRIDGGGGWGFPTNNLTLESEGPVLLRGPDGLFEATLSQDVDLKSGPHVYAGIGFLRTIGKNFDLGVRVRAHRTALRSSVDCQEEEICDVPDGSFRAATLEGRIIITAIDWIRPYLLVGVGVVHTSVDGGTIRNAQGPIQDDTVPFQDVSIVDAGGDVGLGASVPIIGGLALDAEIRAAGSLPGGKDNTVTVAPFTLGLAYSFQ